MAPNQLSFATPEAIKETVGAGSSFEKTCVRLQEVRSGHLTVLRSHYYDALVGFAPNMFSSLSEDFHRLRRRQFNHIFAHASVLEMEVYIDNPMRKYRLAFDKAAESGRPIDIKRWCVAKRCLSCFGLKDAHRNANLIVDAMWEVAFGEPFGARATHSVEWRAADVEQA